MLGAAERVAAVRACAADQARRVLNALPSVAVIIPSSDAHLSEYVAECDKRRGWLSGFNGSAGTAVIMPQPHKSALWTDSRYYLQASKQLDTNVWQLMKDGQPSTPSIAVAILEAGATHVAVDPTTLSLSFARQLQNLGLSIIPLTENPVDAVWKDNGRPPRSLQKIIQHDIKFAGVTVKDKLDKIRTQMANDSCSALVVCALDEVAWLLNLRGSDVLFNPVFFGFALVTLNSCHFFVHGSQLTAPILDELKNDVQIAEYDTFYSFLEGLDSKKKIWVDPTFANFAVLKALEGKSI
jgi:Xaa-Pro aminopeptidase